MSLNLNTRQLKQLRVSRKKSLQEIASAIGLKTAGGYQRIEKGENKLKAEALPVLAQIFNLELNELVKELFFEQ